MGSLASTLVMEPVDTPEKLSKWLEGQSPEIAAAFALRFALQVLPLALVRPRSPPHTSPFEFMNAVFRALVLCINLQRSLNSKYSLNLNDDLDFIEIASQRAQGMASMAAPAMGTISYSLSSAVQSILWAIKATHSDNAAYSAISSFYAAINSYGSWSTIYVNNVEGITRATADAGKESSAIFRSEFETDIRWAEQFVGNSLEAAQFLLKRPLWINGFPSELAEAWNQASDTLRRAEVGGAHWADWYEHRLRGDTADFASTPAVDTEINRRLITADNEWWYRDYVRVNADIAAWLEELSPPPEPTAADLVQQPIALNFVTNDDCVVRLDPTPVGDAVLQDADAVDRHAEARRLAQVLADASSPSLTNRSDVQQFADRYQDALGPTIAELRASATVLHGNSLRRLADLDNEGSALAGPLSDRQQSILHDLLFIHNMLVGLDPYLALRDSVGGGLHKDRASLKVEVAIQVVVSASSAGAIDHQTADAVDEAIKNVPSDAATDDRNWRFVSESLLNVVRSIGSFIWKHKGKVIGGGGATIAGLWRGATWIKGKEPWLSEVFQQWPDIVRIIKWIANLMP